MRAFSTIFIITALTLTAIASTMYRRALTTDFNSCGSSLATLGTSMTTSSKTTYELTNENMTALINPLLKTNDDLLKEFLNAFQSCCSPVANNCNQDENNYDLNEAGKIVKEAESIASALDRLYANDIARSYKEGFKEFSLRVQQSAILLQDCLGELSPKDKMAQATNSLRDTLLRNTFFRPFGLFDNLP